MNKCEALVEYQQVEAYHKGVQSIFNHNAPSWSGIITFRPDDINSFTVHYEIYRERRRKNTLLSEDDDDDDDDDDDWCFTANFEHKVG